MHPAWNDVHVLRNVKMTKRQQKAVKSCDKDLLETSLSIGRN